MSMNASKALGFNDPKFDLNNCEKLKKKIKSCIETHQA